ncbi:hypothetical protein GGR52DRAFT_555693 [Hypoxylon sp. FL1284]|nr:hypothetical protein GGR52DRAFT_555693 [Hypoxylon sp. FL1284]
MADQPRRHRNRPDSKQMWDESERRGKKSRDKRDDRDRGRDREESHRERERDRDRRYRSRSRSPRGDRREKTRDRKDRDRDYPRNKQSEPKGEEKERDSARRDDGRKDRKSKRDNKGREPDERGSKRDRSPRRSASPARSPPSKLERSSHNSPLPTRPRHPGGKSESGSSLQFKVMKHDDEGSRGDRSAAGGRARDASPDADRGRRTETPNSEQEDRMDEDEDGDDDDLVVEDDGLSAMQAMMGFGGFGTTKNTHIPGNNAGAVRKEKKAEYRQYMNRVGGFNRPLSPTR